MDLQTLMKLSKAELIKLLLSTDRERVNEMTRRIVLEGEVFMLKQQKIKGW